MQKILKIFPKTFSASKAPPIISERWSRHSRRSSEMRSPGRFIEMPSWARCIASNASASDGKQEQSVFRDAPFPLSGLQLVNAIHHEGDDIDSDYII